MTKVIVLCLSATCALTTPAPGPFRGAGVRVIGFSPVRLSFEAANEDARPRRRNLDGRIVSLR